MIVQVGTTGRGCEDADVDLLPAVKELLDLELPPLLYHYTGPQAFVGICQNRELWAGRAADMNDSTEQLLIFDIANDLLKNYPNDDRGAQEFVEALRESISFGLPARRMRLGATFTVSLTTEADSLEQWRAYCPRSGGIAFALPSSHLQELAEANKFYLAPCVYDADRQRKIVTVLVEEGIDRWLASLPLTGGDPIDDLYSAANAFFGVLCEYAPLLKHEAFRMEREWRLISETFPDGDRNFVSTSDGLRMYLPFNLESAEVPRPKRPRRVPFSAYADDWRSPIPDVSKSDDWRLTQYGCVLGPNRDQAAMWGAVRLLMDRGFGHNSWIAQTRIPYR